MFGSDGFDDVPISTAVRASGALPMVYAPVNIDGRELVDGGIVSTTNLDIAVRGGGEAGRGRSTRSSRSSTISKSRSSDTERYASRARVSDMGFPQIGYQAFKLLAHRRLHEMVGMWEERYPGVDIVLIEPELTDELMFQTSMMSFSSRIEIARHGFQSVTYHLAERVRTLPGDLRAPRAARYRPSACAEWSSISIPSVSRPAPGARSSRAPPGALLRQSGSSSWLAGQRPSSARLAGALERAGL